MQDTVSNFLKITDESIETLSHMKEGSLSKIPSWILSNRQIDIAFVTNNTAYLIKIAPNESLEEDTYSNLVLNSQEEIDKFFPYFPPGMRIQINGFFMLSGLKWYKDEPKDKELYKVPERKFDGIIIYGTEEEIKDNLVADKTKHGALNIWNNHTSGLNSESSSFYEQMDLIFIKFQCLIKKKSFLEKRIHRYLNDHADKLLPSHKKVYFEHELKLNGKSKFADFILQMEELQPALLVELENPTKILIKKNGEITSEGLHARYQILEWIRFIAQNPENTRGQMSFLQGEKRRLVVMGNSNGNIEALKNNSIYSDTVFWTYDILLEEAKKRWNKIIEEQCNLLGTKMEKKF